MFGPFLTNQDTLLCKIPTDYGYTIHFTEQTPTYCEDKADSFRLTITTVAALKKLFMT